MAEASSGLSRRSGRERRAAWSFRHRRRLLPLAALALAGFALAPIPGSPWTPLGLALLALGLLVVAPGWSEGASLAPSLGPRTWGLLLGAPPWAARRGDLVVIAFPGLRVLTKRVAGLPGDVLVFRDGGVYRGDEELPLAADLTQLDPRAPPRVILVPEGHLFVLGEHVSSLDSRHLGAFPRSSVLARYRPVVHLGALRTPLPTLAQQADVEALRVARPPFLPRLERILAVGGWSHGHLELALRRAWLELDRPDRVDAVLERAWSDTARATEDRELWTRLLAELHLDRDPERALAAVRRHLRSHAVDEGSELFQWEAHALVRLARWTEALASAERLERVLGPGALLAVRLSALLGLGRTDEAAAAIEAGDAEGRWAAPAHAPYYRALLAAARGDHEEAARRLREALSAGFADRALMERTPHLATFRATRHWGELGR